MKFFAVLALVAAAVALPREAHSPRQGCAPGTYRCTPGSPSHSWEVCDVSRNWLYAGSCAPGNVCKFYPPSQSPYCVPPDFNLPNGK